MLYRNLSELDIFVALGTYGYIFNLASDSFFDIGDIFLCRLGERFICSACGNIAEALQIFDNGLCAVEALACRERSRYLAVNIICHANWNLIEIRKHIHLCQRDIIGALNLYAIA